MMKRFLLAVCVVVAFATGYGVVTYAYPSGGVHGRGEFRGYFTNTRDTNGWEVLNVSCSTGGEWGSYNYNNGNTWCNTMPSGLNSASRFISFIEGRLANGVPNGRYGFGGGSYGDRRAKTGAAMIVHTMLGTPAGSRNRPPTGSQMNEWRRLVNQYANAGLVRWSTGAHTFSLNSYFQGTDNNPNPNDDAFYDERNDGLAIVFYNPSGGVAYALRRECGNPVGRGSLSPLEDFDLKPRINVTIQDADGQDVSAEGVAEAGHTIEFTYSVRNSGRTQSRNVDCTYRRATHSGFNESAPTSGFVPPGANCPPPRTFPRNTTTTAVESVPGSAVNTNTTICRSFSINPATQDGGTETVQACIPVVAKPYSRVYGGDVSAGNGLTTAPDVCTNNNDASVVGWNRRSAAAYAGAGAQYAVMALDEINDFSTALGNSGGAPRPHGLAFANTSTNVGSGRFGGEFGSVPCIPDYYADRPDGAPSASSNLSSLTSGTYTYDGTLSLSGNVNPGEFITIYVDGDAHITGDITYPGSWSVNNLPVFQLIVQGNIFVDNDVSRLDGMYVAQADGASGGVIHTCVTAAAPLALDGSLYDTCNNKLTINGAFIANQVRLLRTSGTLSQSNAGESSGGSAGGEVFNFSPALWLRQPEAPAGETGDYDAIISLPPIL